MTWTEGVRLPRSWLYDVACLDANTSTVVGWDDSVGIQYGVIIRTTDGGTTWATKSHPARVPLNGVSFADANIGTAVGGGWDNQASANVGSPYLPWSGSGIGPFRVMRG